jgi:hypothetical protein
VSPRRHERLEGGSGLAGECRDIGRNRREAAAITAATSWQVTSDILHHRPGGELAVPGDGRKPGFHDEVDLALLTQALPTGPERPAIASGLVTDGDTQLMTAGAGLSLCRQGSWL